MSKIGYDILGLAHKRFPWKMVLRNLPSNVPIGVFDHPFGDVRKRLKKYLDSGKFKAVRVQLFWDAAHRKLIPARRLRKKCKQYEQIAQQYPDVEFYLSHTCEHTSNSSRKLKKRIDIINRFAPSCIPVNNPLSNGMLLNGVVNERHNIFAPISKPYIASLDGTDALLIDLPKWLGQHKQAKYRFMWTNSFNLRKANAPFVPIPNRTVRVKKSELDTLKREAGL